MKILLKYIFLFYPISVFTQQSNLDSLSALLKTDKEDTNKVKHLNGLALEFNHLNPDTAMWFSNEALFLSEKIKWQEGIGNSLNQIASFHNDNGDYDLSLQFYLKALDIWEQMLSIENAKPAIKIRKAATLGNIGIVYGNQSDYFKALFYYRKAIITKEEIGDKHGIAVQFNNIGNVYKKQGNYSKAIDFYFKALIIFEDVKEKINISTVLGNIGNIYLKQSDYPQALDYYLRALKIDEELGEKNGMAIHLGNIGNAYREQGNLSKALEYYLKSQVILEEIGAKKLISSNLGNIGLAYAEQANTKNHDDQEFKKQLFDKALNYYFKALKIDEELCNKNGITRHLGNIGLLYTNIGEFTEAEKYLKSSLMLADSISYLEAIKEFNSTISNLYDTLAKISENPILKLHNIQLAFAHYKKYIAASDSIKNDENIKKQTQAEMNYVFEKKEALTQSEHEKQFAIEHEEKKKQKIIIYSVSAGFFLVALFAGLIFRKNKEIAKRKREVEKAKEKIEEHQKEIIDSITYARRLQQAILPPPELIKKHLPESFLFYKPKDIVAGDFYWMEIIDSSIFIAAADCTGHGVPGAMVSVVCSNALNRTVKEFGLRDTGKILDKVTDLVLETFEKSGEQIKDGMDISLLGFNQTSRQIQWSGANNPLWYIQNGHVIEIKADKQPVGKYDKRKPFTTHCIEHSDNIVYYLFTDGLPDQFGGPKGKKFMYKRFENNLSDISKLPMDEQQAFLEKAFQDWKGTLEQVDDVTVIGIRI